MAERDEPDEELTPEGRFILRMLVLGVLYGAVVVIWLLYLNSLLELSHAGLLSFFPYYYASQNTPMVMSIANGLLVLSALLLTCKEMVRRSDASTTQEQ